jgi:hypothetical protein
MLKRRGRWRTLLGLKGELLYYDSDPEVLSKKLTSFEQKTLWIAVLSGLAAFGAAYFILQQFKEMAAQTDLLSRSLRQARNDSKDTAVNAEKQLALTQQSVGAIQRQATTAQRQMETAQSQLELSERPWVTLEGTFGKVDWEVERGPKFLGKEELTTFMNLQMPMDYALRNLGKSPANRTFISMRAMPTDFGKNFTRPMLPMNMACSEAESERKLAEKPESLSHGIVIFPQATPVRRTWIPTVGFREDNFETISGVWIAACIVYQAGFSPHVYHTKLWFLSLPTQGVTQAIPIQPDQPFTWHPFDRFVLYDSEAD